MAPRLRRRNTDIAPGLTQAPLSPLLKKLYSARGITQAGELDLSLAGLAKPQELLGCDMAAALLADAIEGDASVVIVADFDADGATSAALGVSLLRQMGLRDVHYLVPNRFEFGYGLSPEIVALAAERAPDLLVTVDNGISSHDGVLLARHLGMSVLITDHHLPGATLPEADVIVNPNQPGCRFPSKSLAGVGVMFYVMTALRAELRSRGWFEQNGLEAPNLADALDLVALGTVADVVPLDRNNRILVAGGLARIRAGRSRPGIDALFEVAGRDPSRLTSTDLGFVLGPRLNAAGRLDDMSTGIECLLADSTAAARPLAQQLDQLNRERRDIEAGMQAEALAKLESTTIDERDMPLGLSIYDASFHQGVVGIVAARLRERYHRPVIVFADGDDGVKGSARSIDGVHIRDVLDRVASMEPGLITKFGGHAMAAGLSLAKADLSRFQLAFDRAVREALGGVEPSPEWQTDGPLASGELTLQSAVDIASAGPWGQHFPEPSFDGEFVVLEQRLVGEKHLKLRLQTELGPIDAIAFNIDLECWPDNAVTRIGAVYRIEVNSFRGEDRLQLMLQTLWPLVE